MKKHKLKLKEFSVKSFVTEINIENVSKIKSGGDPPTDDSVFINCDSVVAESAICTLLCTFRLC